MTGETEKALQGGNVTTGLVRLGDTVRRPTGAWSRAVHALLCHLEAVGYPGSPRSLGFDAEGRHVVEYIPGDVSMPFAEPSEDAGARLHDVGEMIKAYHDAVADFEPPEDARWIVAMPSPTVDLIAHHDLAPWNLISSPRGLVFIDWDGAGPGSRLWDLSYAAHGFVPLSPETAESVAKARLRALADGYGLDQEGRLQLPSLIAQHTRSMYELLRRGNLTGQQPWARLWEEGHGAVWLADAEFVEERLAMLADALLD